MVGDTVVEYVKRGPVAHIWLNRPEVLNAYNVAMRDELYEALGAIAEDDDVAVVLLRGRGRSFCAGADLTEFGTAPSQAIARQVRWQRDVWGRLLDLPVPVICAIQGHCIGSGVELALLCDLRLASAEATFAMPEVQLGMIPAAGGSQTLPRSLGLSAALELLLTGGRIDSAEARRIGLVSRVLPTREALDSEAEALARQLVPIRRSIAAVKQAVREGAAQPMSAALHTELRLSAQAHAATTHVAHTHLGGNA